MGDMLGFFAILPRVLRPGGRFSFFNGLSDSNIYAQAFSCRVAQIDLAQMGMATLFEAIPLGEVEDDEWKKVVNHYWSLETYYAPISFLLPSEKALAQGARVNLSVLGAKELRSNAVQVGDQVGKSLTDKLERANSA